MLTIGILGCGRIGQVHAASLTQISGARVGGVADPVAAAAQALSDKTGAPVMTGEALIDSPKIDAVVIGTTTDTHFDLIQKAAKAGKAIFCEKPIDCQLNVSWPAKAWWNKQVLVFLRRSTADLIPTLRRCKAEWPLARLAMLNCSQFSAATPLHRRCPIFAVQAASFAI